MGVRCEQKASNIGCWTETGRLPLGVKMAKMFYNYGLRCIDSPDDSLLHHAIEDQKFLNLQWYTRYQHLDTSFSPQPGSVLSSSSSPTVVLTKAIKGMFKAIWSGALQQSKKLLLLKSIKSDWGPAPYINDLSFNQRKTITRIRLSAHRLPIEVGRYTRPITPQELRFCKLCQFKSNVNSIGDERHLLFECSVGQHIRMHLKGDLKSAINGKDLDSLFKLQGKNMRDFGIYANKVYTAYLDRVQKLQNNTALHLRRQQTD